MGSPSELQNELLEEAVSRYKASFTGSPAEEYIASRGLAEPNKWCLGYVEDPVPGHEKLRGCLAIPYLRHHPIHGWSCATIRFRRLDGEKPKYCSLPGDTPHLFNTKALDGSNLTVGVCEGEVDAITATQCGLPTVGIPGATTWKDYWEPLFRGYKAVYVLCDGDEAGEKFGKAFAHRLKNTILVHHESGEDTNSLFTSQGEEAVQKLWSKL